MRQGQVHLVLGLILLLVILPLQTCTRAAAIAPLTGKVTLQLKEDGDGRVGQPVTLDLSCDGGAWNREVWASAPGFNTAQHQGWLKAASEGTRVRLEVWLRLNRDKWSEGGEAEYTLLLQRVGDWLEGTFTGSFNGGETHGRAAGEIRPLQKARKGFTPVQQGEHPRLLFRRSQVPDLKARAKTPLGQKMITRLKELLGEAQRNETREFDGDSVPGKAQTSWISPEYVMNNALGYGLLYQLTGALKYAVSASARIRWALGATMDEVYARPETVLSLAAAYDLVYDACDPGLRQKVNEWLLENRDVLLLGTRTDQFDPAPDSYINAYHRSALGMAALTLLGEPGDYPPAPNTPTMLRLQAQEDIPPGSPVSLLTAGEMPERWIAAGPFRHLTGGIGPSPHPDPLASMGGEAKARPVAGNTVTFEGVTHTFHPFELSSSGLVAEKKSGLPAGGKSMEEPSFYYTVIQNPRARWYRVILDPVGANGLLYLGGHLLRAGDLVWMPWGQFSMLLEVSPTGGPEAEKAMARPRLLPLSEEEAHFTQTRRQKTYEREQEAWEEGYKEYLKSGRASPEFNHLSKTAERSIQQYIAAALGEHGWSAEGEELAHGTLSMVFRYAKAYQSVTGADLSDRPNLGEYLALNAARMTGATMVAFNGGDGPPGPELFAEGFPLVTEEKKPVVLWEWNQLTGLGEGRVDRLESVTTAVFTFLNYPLDGEARPPAGLLPLVVVDRQKGGYIFRNRYQDQDDFVTQLYLRSQLSRSAWWNVGDGGFRIYGLNHTWAGNGTPGRSEMTDIERENVVQFPQKVYGGRGATAIYDLIHPDGSGVVSMSLNDIPTEKDGKPQGIRQVRSFAVDYSGASGTPALFAVVDKISGGGEKTWQMNVGENTSVTVEGQSFTLHGPEGATLRGTFVTPALVKVKVVERVYRSQLALYGFIEAGSEPPAEKRNVIQASGVDQFFVVMTIQKGPAPPVQIEGAGLDARVHVGKEVVAFDGEKIVIGKT